MQTKIDFGCCHYQQTPLPIDNLLSGCYNELNNLLPLRKIPVKIRLKNSVAIAASAFGISAALLFGLSPINYARAQQADRFSCEDIQGVPTTVFQTPDGEKQLIVWDSEYFAKVGYTPKIRCVQVTIRLNRFFNILSENSLDSGTVTAITKNGTLRIPVIFVVDENTKQKSLLYTLKPGQDGEKAIDLLIGQLNIVKSNTPPVREGKCHKSLNLNSVLEGKPQVRGL